MPKSYLADEPACQRAERLDFDPHRQITSRLHVLEQMGHPVDKIEVIVLGGSWLDYENDYRVWFVTELFRALNGHESGSVASVGELGDEQIANERASHRMVGLVFETRPDQISTESLSGLRELGCTKVQIGVQSLDEKVLRLNDRAMSVERIVHAFELLRSFGFKTHAHFMLNLFGSTPQADIDDYRMLVTDPRFLPDEVKLYPCVLIEGTRLQERYKDGLWVPYREDELVDVLLEDLIATPAYTRISRMIRDFSAHDIVAGNKKANLRQLVEQRAEKTGMPISEMRYREIGLVDIDMDSLELDETIYETSNTTEHFLQWVTPENRLIGFLRLSLPVKQDSSAMIREVHIYGRVARLDGESESAQHTGLGRRLIARAEQIAAQAGYRALRVISAVGTREYYRELGFSDEGLYQAKPLS
jgi:elongator complex protein 3